MGPIKRVSLLMLTSICSLLFLSAATAQSSTNGKPATKVEGWANVPGGTVWLEPGRTAYEHDTGLVRDLRTGQKSLPVTPQSLIAPTVTPQLAPILPNYPLYQVPTYALPSYPPISPPRSPYFATPQFSPAYAPQPWYDLGPGNVYANPKPCNSCGAKLGAPGTINSRWRTTTLPH